MSTLQYPTLYKCDDPRGEAIVAKAVAQTIADAESLWAPEKFDGVFPVRGFGIRRLTPRDIAGLNGAGGTSIFAGTSAAEWTFSIAAAAHVYTNILSGAMISDSCYVIITGFFNYDGTPDVECIKISADGIEYPIINLEEMYGWDEATAYFSHPIIVRPEKTMTIAACARTAGVKYFGLLGWVVAKRSYLIATL